MHFFSWIKNFLSYWFFLPRDAIVGWVKKKIGPGVQNVTTSEEAERVLTSDSPIVVGFFENLVV